MATQMTKSQLVEKVSAQAGLSKKDVKGVLEALATTGYKELKKTGTFLLPGFAKFVVSAGYEESLPHGRLRPDRGGRVRDAGTAALSPASGSDRETRTRGHGIDQKILQPRMAAGRP